MTLPRFGFKLAYRGCRSCTPTAAPIRTFEFWGPVGVLEFENATITHPGKTGIAEVMADGSAFGSPAWPQAPIC